MVLKGWCPGSSACEPVKAVGNEQIVGVIVRRVAPSTFAGKPSSKLLVGSFVESSIKYFLPLSPSAFELRLNTSCAVNYSSKSVNFQSAMAHSENVGPGDQRSPINISSDPPESSEYSEMSLPFRPSSSLRPSPEPVVSASPSPAEGTQDNFDSAVAQLGNSISHAEEIVASLKRRFPEAEDTFAELAQHLRGAEASRRKAVKLAPAVAEDVARARTDEAIEPMSSIPEASDAELRQLEDEDEDEDEDATPPPSSIPSSVPPGDPRIVSTKDYVFETVFKGITILHQREPNHPMFGPIENGKIKCPLGPLKIPNEVSWCKKIRDFARNVEKNTGSEIIKGSCWLWSGASNEILWQKKKVTDAHGNVTGGRYASIMPVRLLCFISDPSKENWAILTDEKYQVNGGRKSKDYPFCHTCHNGQGSKRDKSVPHCVNGMEHGFFGTSAVNNSMKPCAKASGRWECPGHGPDSKRHCKYVDGRTGGLLPCRNGMEVRHRNGCECEPNCFG